MADSAQVSKIHISVLSRAEKRTGKKGPFWLPNSKTYFCIQFLIHSDKCQERTAKVQRTSWCETGTPHWGTMEVLKLVTRPVLGKSQLKTLRTSFKLKEPFYTSKQVNLKRQPEFLKYLYSIILKKSSERNNTGNNLERFERKSCKKPVPIMIPCF